MKILFITAVGFDTPNPNNQMAEIMLNDFLDAGHEVHLIQSSNRKIFPQIPESLKIGNFFPATPSKEKILTELILLEDILTNFIIRFNRLNDG